MCVDERTREKIKGVIDHVCVWQSSENATEWENEGPCIGGGVEWTVSKNNVQIIDLPQDVCIFTPPRGRKRKKKSSALPTPFLPLRPLLQPPAAPSHSSYEPRAGRSEYNFLYCVNVRTIRLNKKKNVYITKRRRLDHCVYHPPGEQPFGHEWFFEIVWANVIFFLEF